MFYRCLIVAIGFAVAHASTAIALDTFTTALHPLVSNLGFDLYLGPPADDNLLATVSPAEITGTSEIELALDGAGNGSSFLVQSAFDLVNSSGTADLGVLGTVDYEFNDLGFDFYTTGSKPVTNGSFEFPYDNSVKLVFNQGFARVSNPQGPIAVLVGDLLPYTLDFVADPFTADPGFTISEPFYGTVDIGPGGHTPDAEANVFVDSIATPIIDVSGLELWARFHGEFHLASPPFPPNPIAGSEFVCSLNTGIDEATGLKLPVGSPDVTFALGAGSAELGGLTPHAAIVTHPWVPDDASAESRWIGVDSPLHEPGSLFVLPGDFYFEVECDLAGFIAETASLRGLRFAADNYLAQIELNDEVIFINPSNAIEEFREWITLPDMIGLGDFQPGINRLRFVVHNLAGGRNPMGFRLEGHVAAALVPEPATWIYGLTALASLAPLLRRRKGKVG